MSKCKKCGKKDDTCKAINEHDITFEYQVAGDRKQSGVIQSALYMDDIILYSVCRHELSAEIFVSIVSAGVYQYNEFLKSNGLGYGGAE